MTRLAKSRVVAGDLFRSVIRREAAALVAFASSIDEEAVSRAVEALLVDGLILTTGVGKSGHVARKVAATMTSTGSPAVFVHPTEAAHGDLGVFREGCALLVFSRSGRATEIYPIVRRATEIGASVVVVSENAEDGLALHAEAVVRVPRVAEAWGHAPTTSTTLQMAAGDALAVSLATARGVTQAEFAWNHPGGELAKVVR